MWGPALSASHLGWQRWDLGLLKKTCQGSWVLVFHALRATPVSEVPTLSSFICPGIPFLADGALDGLGGGQNET